MLCTRADFTNPIVTTIAGARATAAAIASIQTKPLSVRVLQGYFPKPHDPRSQLLTLWDYSQNNTPDWELGRALEYLMTKEKFRQHFP